jgi:hypothetical protein
MRKEDTFIRISGENLPTVIKRLQALALKRVTTQDGPQSPPPAPSDPISGQQFPA